jgi:hypothetical protein
MTFDITKFQGALTGGGARSNLFQVKITNPAALEIGDKASFMVKAAEIPAATIGEATVNYFGRAIKYAGNRTFADWNVTIINDEDFLVRDGMEKWSNALNGLKSNKRSLGLARAAQYKTDATVTQFAKTGRPIRTYNFVGLWPKEVSNIALDWGTNDTIEEFTVSFSYDYWEPLGPDTGRALFG